METIKLQIPTMKSQHCMMVVSGALKNQSGASLKKVSPGKAEIELHGATSAAVIETIERAGYHVTNK